MHNAIVKKKRVLSLSLFLLCFTSVEGVKADSTFFPDDDEITAAQELADESDSTHEWAALNPAPKREAQKDVTPVVKVASAPEQVALEPSVPPKTEDAKAKPLKLTTVAPRPKAQPVQEKGAPAPASPSPQPSLSYTDVSNEHAPLGILEPTKEVHSQRWYIYSSAIRGLKAPSKGIRIVCIEGNTPHRGSEVKALLVDMGIEAEKIQVVQAKGEQDQAGMIYIFGGA